jgi:hypothetical protein
VPGGTADDRPGGCGRRLQPLELSGQTAARGSSALISLELDTLSFVEKTCVAYGISIRNEVRVPVPDETDPFDNVPFILISTSSAPAQDP